VRSMIAVLLVGLTASGAEGKGPHRNTEAIKTLDQFGQCVAQQRTDAIKFLATLPDSREENKQANRISTSRCLPGGMLKFKANLLRGAVAELLLKQDKWALHRVGVKYTFDTPPSEALKNAPDGQRALIALVLFGQCVAHESPDAVKSLLGTSVETRDEALAFAALKEPMTKCSTVDFRADRFQMRGYLAEGAYRNLVTPGAG
jgi:hypothetical protein